MKFVPSYWTNFQIVTLRESCLIRTLLILVSREARYNTCRVPTWRLLAQTAWADSLLF